MEGTTETSSSYKDSFRSGSSPFSKLSGNCGTDRMGTRRGSSDSGEGQQHRNSKTTDTDGVEDRLETEESHTAGLSTSTKSQPMVPYRKLFSFATPLDYALMAVGALAAVADGAILPITVSLLGRVVHALGTHQSKGDLAYQKITQVLRNYFTSSSHRCSN